VGVDPGVVVDGEGREVGKGGREGRSEGKKKNEDKMIEEFCGVLFQFVFVYHQNYSYRTHE